jgi:uncharacterized protein with FMN-binding domain
LRRITLLITSTLAAVILLFSYRTSTRSTQTDTTAAPPGIVTGATPTPETPPGKTGGHPTKRTSPQPTTITVNGPTSQTRYGPVQIQVIITGKKITAVKTLQHPSDDDRSIQIATDALPQLRAETLAAQSSQINSISGATYTSQGYQRSLQGALDLAHFG